MATFKDNFSRQSDIYVKYRPHYPDALYGWLASLTKEHALVWDCGTGNGQAATGLAQFYDKVIATDPSEQQIKNAIAHPKVFYKVEKAESNSIASGSADLVTVANALHWFDLDIFYKEVRRVLKKNGLIAAWCYEVPTVSPEIDACLRHYHDSTLDAYWLPENRLVSLLYATIPFPFEQVESPVLYCERTMDLDDIINYLNTWSATQRFIRENNFNPTGELRERLLAAWKDPKKEKKVRWKLSIKAGRITA